MKKYCIQPFSNIRIDSLNGNPRFRPCCHYEHADTLTTLDGYLDSTMLQELQAHMLTKDELPSGCRFCKVSEDMGHTSHRQMHSNHVSPITQTDITKIEIFPGNACNLRCVSCSPFFSSAIGVEHKKLKWTTEAIIVEQDDAVIDSMKNIDSLKSVSIIGGEFFMTKKSIQILDLIIEKKLAATITTNGTLVDERHLSRLEKIEDLSINISVDGIDEVANFIRYPTDWDVVNANIQTLKTRLSKTKFQILTVMQLLNIQDLDNIIQFANLSITKLSFTPLSHPKWLTLDVLTDNERDILVKELRRKMSLIRVTSSQHLSIENCIKNITSATINQSLRDEFVSKMAQLIKTRNVPQTTVDKVFGILTDLKYEINNKI